MKQEVRNHEFRMRLTPDERRMLERQAAQAQTTLSRYVREQLGLQRAARRQKGRQ